MKTLLKEYGMLGALIVVAMIGYVLFTQHKEDILTYSLDAIGTRLVAMVDNPNQQASIASFFETYKQRVLSNEVPPEQVASVAANVLNLSNSGAKLTPEEAELVLGYPQAAPPGPAAAIDAAAPPVPPSGYPERPAPPEPPVSPQALETLGEHLALMLAFDARLQDTARAGAAAASRVPDHLRYRSDGGLHLLIDPEVHAALPPQERQRIARELKELEAKKLVIWTQHLADTLRAHQEQVRRELHAVRTLRQHAAPEPRAAAALEALKQLELQGFVPHFNADSLHAVLSEALQELEAQQFDRASAEAAAALEAAARELEAVRSDVDAARGQAPRYP